MNHAEEPAPRSTLSNPADRNAVREPPSDWWGILRSLGPGLIIAGSIVGSGELIATTKTGAQAGISLLWLVIIGCVIKVFVQIELGRFTISHGETTLAALNEVPGPRFIVNWIIWFWLAMMLVSMAQLGAIVGGVGQSLAISFPVTGDYVAAIEVPSNSEIEEYIKWQDDMQPENLRSGTAKFLSLSTENQGRIRRGQEIFAAKLDSLGARGHNLVQMVRRGEKIDDPRTWDDKYWAAAVALITSALLFHGRYGLIQNLSTALVVAFTFITIGNVVSLQRTEQWHIPFASFVRGLSFRLPDAVGDVNPLYTALAAFGIIGVGASELVAYPYWCLEKGYARFTGPRTNEAGWAARAKGWIRVMLYDTFLSMAVYTLATIAFFLMGVAVLYPEGRDPDGMRMVSTLASAYIPVFGEYARWLFLVGAVAVLYSTFLVALAGQARMYTDALKVYGLMDPQNQRAHNRGLSAFGIGLPILCLLLFSCNINPVTAILMAGVMQAVLLPMLGFAAIHFRYTKTDDRIAPGRIWDTLLIVSFIGLLIAGVWGAYSQILKLLPWLKAWFGLM